MHSQCYCTGLCNITRTTYDFFGVSMCNLRTISCSPIAQVLAYTTSFLRSNVSGDGMCDMYFMHYGCSGVGMCNISCTAIALVFARVTYHALWLLLCLPVYYLMHSKCSRTDHCHIEYARITFVFAVVIINPAECDCSCVCL